MVSIMVVADGDSGDAGAFGLKERVSALQLRDQHFGAQLLERIRWALEDAERAEPGERRVGGRAAARDVSSERRNEGGGLSITTLLIAVKRSPLRSSRAPAAATSGSSVTSRVARSDFGRDYVFFGLGRDSSVAEDEVQGCA